MSRDAKDTTADDEIEYADGIATHVTAEAAEVRSRRRTTLVRSEIPIDEAPRRARKE